MATAMAYSLRGQLSIVSISGAKGIDDRCAIATAQTERQGRLEVQFECCMNRKFADHDDGATLAP